MTVDGNGIVDAPLTQFVSEMECITCQTPPSNTDATVSVHHTISCIIFIHPLNIHCKSKM